MFLIRKFFCPAVIIGTLPNTIANGQTADAVPLMADLNYIVNQVNANAQAVGLAALLASANSFTQVQSGVAATGAANFPIATQVQNNVFNTLTSSLGTNTVTARIAALALGTHVSGQVFTFIPAQTNTGSVGLTIDATSSRTLQNMGSNLTGAELRAGVPAWLNDDGTFLHLMDGTPFVQGPNLPAAATLNLDAQFGDYHFIDGTAPISAVVLSRGRRRELVFNSSPVITNSASLILPTGGNITPVSGDVATARGEAAGVVRLTGFQRLAGGLVLLGKVAANNSPAISFVHVGGTGDSIIDWTLYDEYEFHFVQVIPATNAVTPQARISEDSGSTYKSGAGTYSSIQADFDAVPAGPTGTTQNTTLWNFTALLLSNSADYGMNGKVTIYKPSNAIKKLIAFDFTLNTTASSLARNSGAGQYSGDSGAWTGIQFLMSAGNITSGTIYAYGIRKS